MTPSITFPRATRAWTASRLDPVRFGSVLQSCRQRPGHPSPRLSARSCATPSDGSDTAGEVSSRPWLRRSLTRRCDGRQQTRPDVISVRAAPVPSGARSSQEAACVITSDSSSDCNTDTGPQARCSLCILSRCFSTPPCPSGIISHTQSPEKVQSVAETSALHTEGRRGFDRMHVSRGESRQQRPVAAAAAPVSSPTFRRGTARVQWSAAGCEPATRRASHADSAGS